MSKINKKHLVLEALFSHCEKNKEFIFHNNLVKEISKKVGFGNAFDVTKLDFIEKLPLFFRDNDICIIHIGSGYHKFIKGINKLYHRFEPMQNSIKWQYQRSLLNEFNDSESNILSVANNQRILHEFLFGKDLEFENLSIEKRPKTYFPHRTKANLQYYFNTESIVAKNQQIEIDLTIEFDSVIGIFEAKNGISDNFNIYQLYHPFLYYHNSKLDFKEVICVYLQRKEDILRLWAYTFKNPLYLESIKFIKSCEYILVR